VGERLHLGPHRRGAHPLEHLLGDAGTDAHEVGDGLPTLAGREELLEPRDVVLRERRAGVVDDERRLVEREPRDADRSTGRLEREPRARGVTEHER